MNLLRNSLFVACVILFVFQFANAHAQSADSLTIEKNEAWVDFPESVDFRLQLSHDEEIVDVRLVYGIDALSCGEVTAVYTPEFTPNTELDITWRWPILQGQLIPPGGKFWWQWEIETAGGEQLVTERQTAAFLDDWFYWQTVTEDNVSVHWYRGPQSLGQDVLDEALAAIDDLGRDTGVYLNEPFDIYLYDESFDLQVSVPGAPAWAGGAAFPEHNVVLVTANPDYLTYALRTTRHELGHLVVGRLTFNCTNDVPTWLHEGIAQVAEGEPEEGQADLLNNAVENDDLLSFNQLGAGFSLDPDQAFLSYAQSYNFIEFLIINYGQEKLLTLLDTFQAGSTTNDAMLTTYGLSLHALESEWRESIGADPLPEVEETTAETPTPIPTLSLLGNPPTSTPAPATSTAVPATATPQPTLEPTQTATVPAATAVSQLNPTTEPSTITIEGQQIDEPQSSFPTIPVVIGTLLILGVAGYFILRNKRVS
ncbi:MAG: peptidase MA family metallohydrolase [Chloroflexota bacterium]